MGADDFTDDQLFSALSAFQADRRLKTDATMNPEGETARELGLLLAPNTPKVEDPVKLQASDQSPSKEACDHLFWNVDVPTCRAIEARRGKRAAARCYHTAAARYGACLKGRPIDQLPPLDTWN